MLISSQDSMRAGNGPQGSKGQRRCALCTVQGILTSGGSVARCAAAAAAASLSSAVVGAAWTQQEKLH